MDQNLLRFFFFWKEKRTHISNNRHLQEIEHQISPRKVYLAKLTDKIAVIIAVVDKLVIVVKLVIADQIVDKLTIGINIV